MKKLLLLLLTVLLLSDVFAQPATFSIPVSIGRDNCGSGADSVYYYNYTSPILTKAGNPIGCLPQLRIGAASKTFSRTAASISFNPKDQMIYYLWTNYAISPVRTYVWRWNPATCPTSTAPRLDTTRSFAYDIGGVTFDGNGTSWVLEFSNTAPFKAYLRQMDLAAGIVGSADTLDLTGGKKLWNVGSGDITLMPSGQMYFVFDNKLFTPNYTSFGSPGRHMTCTYIDTVKLPAGATSLVGLAYANGDLVASYAAGCRYNRINPVTADTAVITYNYAANKGVYAADMGQINSGVGNAKKLVSVTPTGTANQYTVVYDILVRNYGNVPITNVQLSDNLGLINGASNVSNVTVSLTSNPAGVSLNPLYNGTTITNLLAIGQGLPCYPQANNNFTIRISCRLSGINPGIIYKNSAVASGNGFNNVALRDSSTNGPNPDLNSNDKPDDITESQPTPFIISITPTTPPCTIGNLLYNQTFGSGVGISSSLPVALTPVTGYTGSVAVPTPIERFSTTDSSQRGNPTYWVPFRDHTGNGGGRFMTINADAAATTMYKDTMPVACSGQQYSVAFWAAFLGNSTYQTVCDGLGGFKYPKILIRVTDRVTGLVITEFTTPDITNNNWTLYGIRWVMPAGYSNVILELINAGEGGCGNDIALDDIQFGTCDALPTVSVNTATGGCLGTSTTFTANVNDPAATPGAKDYQWQISTDNFTWSNIGGASAVTFTINPIGASDVNKYYRVIIAAQGNIGVAGCQYTSPSVYLTAKTLSVAATSATKNKNNVCPGNTVTLTLSGGTLGTNAVWNWYSGSCGGTLVGTGTSITVTPLITTTYYVRAEGDCNTTACVQVTVTISCDIDKDKDGIPDFVESYMPAAFQDANSNGIINAYDPTYAGFVDWNGDFINDNFTADGDSDNDGIQNYLDTDFPGRIDSNSDGVDDRFDMDKDGKVNMLDLDSDNDGIPDVVEAGGVDADGNGKIDSYTDTDGDGLSQNVDTNNSGAYNSGVGLGPLDLDGDGKANAIDLDSDNDGIPDLVEAGGADTNFNGIIDGFVDANGDGLSDNAINATALLKTGADTDGDGRADSYPYKNFDSDKRANPYDLDSDNDGITDVIEAGYTDAAYDGFIDGPQSADGWNTARHGVALNLLNTDNSFGPDYLDIDADNDGIPDNIEGQSTNGYRLPWYVDADKDGLDDGYDNNLGNFGGGGIFVVNTDGDLLPDYRDLDTDADGAPDIIEGNDFDRNGRGDDIVTLTGLDADGDGLDNRFDSLNNVINFKGTSYNMGNGGSTTGDATPGARCPVQKTFAFQYDRDWRYAGYVLNINLIKFSAVPQGNTVSLNWTLITSQSINRFELERSTDNQSFSTVNTLVKDVPINQQRDFGTTDDISQLTAGLIYYRLKIIAGDGQVKYSQVLLVKYGAVISNPVSIHPNPATDQVTIRFNAAKDGEGHIRLIDNLGKVVLLQKQKVTGGQNVLQLSGLARFTNGTYTVQVLLPDEVLVQKLLIRN
ncbi:MAG: type sorting protein [Ferruginibacter sp.]|nr:type sorting protein [Ferruginibacter sp.]